MKEQLQAALTNRNVIAFLRVIRAGESSQDDGAYHTLVGNTRFESLDRHPRQMVWLPNLRVNSSAAGAYQFLGRTWDECVKALGLQDFGKASQDLAAVFLIRRRGALDDVIAGRFEAAIKKCAKEWASLPGSPYGQPVMTMAKAKAVYAQYGGVLYMSPERVRETPKTEHVAKEAPVALPAILAALLPSLIQVVPKLGKMFGSGSEVSERNVAAVTMAMDVAKEALGAKSAQEAIETSLADPEAAQQVRQAIESRWLELSEAGGDGIAGARAAALAYSQPDGPRFWFNPAFWVSMILLTMPIMLLIDVFYVHPEAYVGEIRTQIVTGILLVIGMVGGYWIGTSFSSARKTEIAANGKQP